MKQKISNLQLTFLIANLIYSSALISLPQIIVQVGGQNSWLVPIILLPIVIVIIFFLFGKTRNAEQLSHLFSMEEKKKFWEKAFVIIFLLTVILVFLRDLRGTVDFIATVLLPTTPIDIMTVLAVLVITYLAMSGIEVISRINAIHFGLFMLVSLLLPIFLINEIDYRNLQPLPGLNDISYLLRAVLFDFSWAGEVVLSLIIIASVHPVQQARRAVIIGTSIGVFLYSLTLLLSIAVLGTKIVGEATYPAFIVIQQINMTDFLDRLDPLMVVIWLPAILTKVAYLLYALNYCLSYLYKSNTNKFLPPISLILGYLSILIFKNNMDHLHFSFFTWSALGLALEVILILMFFIVRKTAKGREV